MADTLAAWNALAGQGRTPIAQLIADEGEARLDALVHRQSGIRFDWTKTHLDTGTLARFAVLADAAGLNAARRALFAGERVNVTEGRAAEHSAERGEGHPESVAEAPRSMPMPSAPSRTSSTLASAARRSVPIFLLTRSVVTQGASMSPSCPMSMGLRWQRQCAGSIRMQRSSLSRPRPSLPLKR